MIIIIIIIIIIAAASAVDAGIQKKKYMDPGQRL